MINKIIKIYFFIIYGDKSVRIRAAGRMHERHKKYSSNALAALGRLPLNGDS